MKYFVAVLCLAQVNFVVEKWKCWVVNGWMTVFYLIATINWFPNERDEFFVLIQVVLSAPSEPTVVEQAAAALASAQSGATAAVAALSEKALSVAGVKSNEELLTNVQQQGEAYVTQIKGEDFVFI